MTVNAGRLFLVTICAFVYLLLIFNPVFFTCSDTMCACPPTWSYMITGTALSFGVCSYMVVFCLSGSLAVDARV